jgi:hypothetical protein
VVEQLFPSPDGKTLACVGRSQLENQNAILFLDSTTGQDLHRSLGFKNYVEPSLAFAPDSRTWALANRKDNEIGVYETRTGRDVRGGSHSQKALPKSLDCDARPR